MTHQPNKVRRSEC